MELGALISSPGINIHNNPFCKLHEIAITLMTLSRLLEAEYLILRTLVTWTSPDKKIANIGTIPSWFGFICILIFTIYRFPLIWKYLARYRTSFKNIKSK